MATTELPVFYYAQGTSWLINMLGWTVGITGGVDVNVFGQNVTLNPTAPGFTGNCKALDGKFVYWDGAIINDPFPRIISPLLWQYKRVEYPASTLLIGPSIEYGVEWIINDIEKTPIGTPFALGGYSQGAAVMSRIYNECRSGRLRNRRHDLRAVVAFGNPMREEGHTYPGSSGYSGAADIPLDTRTGHGIFPKAGTFQFWEPYVSRFARLTNTEDFFWDFTMPNEAVTGIGDSEDGLAIQWLTKEGLRQIPVTATLIMLATMFKFTDFGSILGKYGTPPPGVPTRNGNVLITDYKTGEQAEFPGGGHVMFPHFPPPNSDGIIPPTGDTCYQIAAKYLNRVGETIYDEMHPTVPAPTNPISYQWFSSIK